MHDKHRRTLARPTPLAVAVVLCALAAVLPGCAFKPGMLGWFHEEPPAALPPDASLSDIVGHLNQSIAQVRAWQSTQVKIVARGNGMPPVRLKAKISVEEPRNFRLMVDAMGNREADLGSNAERFWFWIRRGPNFIFTARHEDIANVAQMPFDPSWVMEALGVVPLREPELTLERASETDSVVNLVAMRTSPDGRSARHVARVDTHSGHVISHELFDSSKRLIARAELSDYRPETTHGVMLPHEVHLDWPAHDFGLTMYLGAIELNPSDFPAVTWNMPQYKGCRPLDIAHLPTQQRRSLANEPVPGVPLAQVPDTRRYDGGAPPRGNVEPQAYEEEEWVPDTLRNVEPLPEESPPGRGDPRMNQPKQRGSSSTQGRNWWQKMFGR
jgi:hypothetical protein